MKALDTGCVDCFLWESRIRLAEYISQWPRLGTLVQCRGFLFTSKGRKLLAIVGQMSLGNWKAGRALSTDHWSLILASDRSLAPATQSGRARLRGHSTTCFSSGQSQEIE